jgi:hypothetical protein
MAEVKKHRTAPSAVKCYRKVVEPIHKLAAGPKKKLLGKPFAVFFSPAFLQHALRSTGHHTNMKLIKCCPAVIDALSAQYNVNVVADAVKLTYDQLDSATGVGAAGIALYLDVLAAFDLPLPQGIPGRGITLTSDAEAAALAEELGIK